MIEMNKKIGLFFSSLFSPSFISSFLRQPFFDFLRLRDSVRRRLGSITNCRGVRRLRRDLLNKNDCNKQDESKSGFRHCIMVIQCCDFRWNHPCCLGGLVVGLVEGLAFPDAALLGNLFGSITLEHIGQPKFDLVMLKV